jgi:sugar lactone lactonase YvrE
MMGRVRLCLLLCFLVVARGEADTPIDSLISLPAWSARDTIGGFTVTPNAMAVDPLGRLWVLDRARGRVMHVSSERGGSSFAIGGSRLDLSVADDLASSGAFLYVLQAATPSVSLLDLDGHFRESVDLASAIERSSSSGFLPSRILVDRSGDLWLIEAASGGLLRINRRGRFLDEPLEALSGSLQPARIADAALGPGDELVLLDPTGPSILVLGPDGILRGEHRLEGELRQPASLAVDRSGSCYVVEATGRVRVFADRNRLLFDGILPDEPATGPQRVCVIADSILCRADPVRGTIRRWHVRRTGSEDAGG